MNRNTLFYLLMASMSSPILPGAGTVSLRVKERPDSFARRWVLPGVAYGGMAGAGVSALIWAYLQFQLRGAREELAYLNGLPADAVAQMSFYDRAMLSYRKLEAENRIVSLTQWLKRLKKLAAGLAATSALGFIGKGLDNKFGWFGNSDKDRIKIAQQTLGDAAQRLEKAAKEQGALGVEKIPDHIRTLPYATGVIIERGGGGDCAIHAMYGGLSREEKRRLGLTAQTYQEQVDEIRKKIVDEVARRVHASLNRPAEEIKEQARKHLDDEHADDQKEGTKKADGLARRFARYLNISLPEVLPEFRDDALVAMAYDQLRPYINAALPGASEQQLALINELVSDQTLFLDVCEQLYGRKAQEKIKELKVDFFTQREGQPPADEKTNPAQFERDLSTVSLRDIEGKYNIVAEYKKSMSPPEHGWLDDLEIRIAAERVFKRPICIWRGSPHGFVLARIANGKSLKSLHDAIHIFHNSSASRDAGSSNAGNHYQGFDITRFLPTART